jgi:hypothetical protein
VSGKINLTSSDRTFDEIINASSKNMNVFNAAKVESQRLSHVNLKLSYRNKIVNTKRQINRYHLSSDFRHNNWKWNRNNFRQLLILKNHQCD